MRKPRIRVALIYGGRNSEYAVSRASATSIRAHLDPARYDVLPIHIDPDGHWTIGVAPGTPAPAPVAAMRGIPDALAALRTCDVALPALHGRFGEDGTLQSLLAFAGVPYAGNGVLASATGIDKRHTKALLAAEGFRVARGLAADDDELTDAERAHIGLPAFVKPAHGGSSVGVSRVDDWADLPKAIHRARVEGGPVLVEAAVRGREVDVAVLEMPDGQIVAGPPLEIRVTGEQAFFDYDAKYSGAGSAFDIPARLPAEVTRELQAQAVRAFTTLGCAGLLRVDFFLPDATDPDSTPVINEVNTFPGMTAASQFPRIWAAAGIPYPRLLDLLISTALRRRGVGPGAAGADPRDRFRRTASVVAA